MSEAVKTSEAQAGLELLRKLSDAVGGARS